jgi:hypothetical protein
MDDPLLINIQIGLFILGFAFFIVLLYLGRELVTWYWKITEIVEILKDIRDKLNKNESNQIDKEVSDVTSVTAKQ